MAKRRVLRFGIQSLDKLIGTVRSKPEEGVVYGIDISEPPPSSNGKRDEAVLPITSSICLAGPDGTGKSLLSLHLAAHYLADCLAECLDSKTPMYKHLKVLYISTDLTYKMALKGWTHFALDHPLERSEPLVELKEGRKKREGSRLEIRLKQYFPTGEGSSSQSIVRYLESYSHAHASDVKAEVCFVDLASRTAGDDWGFVHRLLSSLEEPALDEPRHLVILDAVEGFETLVGDLNAFGEKSSRRSRIAQVMRLAAGRCHLLLVVEEGRRQRFPEEFVTDVVIRLRNVETGRYVRRTMEIEKARGQSHTRGQHPYVVREGIGSKTGSQQNADDPMVLRNNHAGEKSRTDEKVEHQGYIHVFPSLDYTSREIMVDRSDPLSTPDKPRFAAFGLPYLDTMLGGKGETADRDSTEGFDTKGLPCSSATALIGDSLTQKSQLGKAFLSRAFYSFAEDLLGAITEEGESSLVNEWVTQFEDGIRDVAHGTMKAPEVAKRTIETIATRVEQLSQRLCKENLYPVAVLFTTQDLNPEGLVDEFYQWLRDEEHVSTTSGRRSKRGEKSPAEFEAQMPKEIDRFGGYYKKHVMSGKYSEEGFRTGKAYVDRRDEYKRAVVKMIARPRIEPLVRAQIKRHTICRRLEIHDLPGPVLMNIFQRGIEKAQRTMFFEEDAGDQPLPQPAARFRESWRIRVVVDDLNSLRNTYPEMREDPLMLPSLLFMFGREGVTSLFVDTQASGSPELSITERFDSSVRELVQTRIYIWRLPFYGENRVAMSVIPPMSHEYRGLIRELRWETKNESQTDRALIVDPHFELYSGLERAQPQPVPLEVRLYCDTTSVAQYISTEEKLLREIFTPVLKHNHEANVIVPAELHEYEALRDACHVQRDTRLDHTTIVQVNEFWWLRRPRQRRAGAFRPQWNYLNAVTATLKEDKYLSDPVADPFWVFQPSPFEQAAIRKKKKAPLNQFPRVKRKVDFFDRECGYGYELLNANEEEKHYVDRVPYTWDFGFLLCNGKAWEEACGLEKHSLSDAEQKVAAIWHRLRKATDKLCSPAVCWRDFLSASKIVAEFQSFRTSTRANAFDFTMLIPESFSCLILEMWFSEAYDTLKEYERQSENGAEGEFGKNRMLLEEVGKRRWYSEMHNPVSLLSGLKREKRLSLEKILNQRASGEVLGFSLELYKVWLLLSETLNFEGLLDNSSHLNFEFKSRDVGPTAVSARHWYKTASSFMDSLTPEQVEYNWVPVRLPGHFSVRADWFLAVAGGSRSSRLADHALDLLSSKRSNVTRLQGGLGLPPRKLFEGSDDFARLRTRLISAQKGQALSNIEYDSLRRIGAQSGEEEFFWLWRSGIWGYNRHSRIWHKWLNRALLWWHSWHQRYGSNWAGGFRVYDLLKDSEFHKDRAYAGERRKEFEELKLESWAHFAELRDILIAELEQVSLSRT